MLNPYYFPFEEKKKMKIVIIYREKTIVEYVGAINNIRNFTKHKILKLGY